MQLPIHVADEVSNALNEGRAVVALESTIITHGLPRPTNLEVAAAVESRVRTRGAVPATISISDGMLRVGLSDSELEMLAESASPVKVSRRDIPFVLRSGAPGGTTVAATMLIARLAGIDVFATGGIGGVHRGASDSFDISADLQELAKTDVAVVSAGFKSILDIGLTLEYLETAGVPVVGYRTHALPAFYARESGFDLDHRVDTPDEVAEIMALRRRLGLGGGMVIANPIPADAAMDSSSIESAIEAALADAAAAQISGKEVTPFVLERLVDMTDESSLAANEALVLNNASVAADVAKAFVELH